MARKQLLTRLRDILQTTSELPSAMPRIRGLSEPALFAPSSRHLANLAGVFGEIGVSAFVAYAYLSEVPHLSPQAAAGISSDRDAVFDWYLCEFAPRFAPRGAPLSADDISYLTTMVPVPSRAFVVPRVVLWNALKPFSKGIQPLLAGDEAALAYWWAVERAAELGVEDCLVPDRYLACLQKVSDGELSQSGLIEAFEKHEGVSDALMSLDGFEQNDLTTVVSLSALKRPLLAVCLGRSVVEAALHPASPVLERIMTAAFGSSIDAEAIRKNMPDLLDRAFDYAGFDRERWKFKPRSSPADGVSSDATKQISSPALLNYDFDLEVVGPFSGSSGLTAAAKASVIALEGAGARVRTVDVLMGCVPARVGKLSERQGEAAATLFHVNPDVLPILFADRSHTFARRRAGYFFWELDAPASSDFLALDLVDEIWVATSFVRSVYAPAFAGVVERVGLVVPAADDEGALQRRGHLLSLTNLEPHAFLVATAFDGLSFIERKNPLGAVTAFQASFPDDRAAALIIKTQNRPVGPSGVQGRIWNQLDAFRAADPRIHLLEATFPHGMAAEILGGADVFLSLHRSEGFGIPVAEAMMRGVPVVVTAYGGTEDFCDDESACRVPFTLSEVAEDAYVRVEPGRVWAEPDVTTAAGYLRRLRDDNAWRKAKAEYGKAGISRHASVETVAPAYAAALQRLLSR